MADAIVKGIRGWLLVFVIWTGVSICIALAYSIYNLILDWPAGGIIRALSIFSTLVFVIWYAYYAWLLLKFIQEKPGVMRPIIFMLAATPFLNLVMPGICGVLAGAILPDIGIGDMLAEIYVSQTLGSGFVAIIIAACWLVYFFKSVRVRNTFPEIRNIGNAE